MRRLITAIAVPIALLSVVALTASAADAGNVARAGKSKVAITSLTTPPPDHTWVFKGKVTSRNAKCLSNRRVDIYVAASGRRRGSAPDGPVASGKTNEKGKFKADTGQELLLLAPYQAVVAGRKHKGLTCQEAESKPFNPQT